MQVRVNTDDNVAGRAELARWVESEVLAGLSRFKQQVTRVEVHLGDENAAKSGEADKRCMMEARAAGQQPLSVTHHASTLHEACRGAIRKLKSALDGRHAAHIALRDGSSYGPSNTLPFSFCIRCHASNAILSASWVALRRGERSGFRSRNPGEGRKTA